MYLESKHCWFYRKALCAIGRAPSGTVFLSLVQTKCNIFALMIKYFKIFNPLITIMNYEVDANYITLSVLYSPCYMMNGI